jgi:type III secretion system YscQ/HrcQ family protein
MKADSTAQAEASEANLERAEAAADPFAEDLFAAHRPGALIAGELVQGKASESGPESSTTNPPWHARLPRCSREEARLSSALDVSFPNFGATAQSALAHILSRYMNVPADAVSLAMIDLRERKFARGELGSETSARLWATLLIAPSEASLAGEMETEFAIALIDRLLSGDGPRPDSLRDLSRTEQAVIEFLWLCLIRELNKENGEPLLRLEGVQAQPPGWLFNPTDEGRETTNVPRGLVATVRLRAGSLDGLVRLYLTPGTLSALESLKSSRLFDESRADAQPTRLARLKQVAPSLRLRPVLGTTELSAAELVQLEAGDVLVINRPLVRLREGQLTGRLEIRLGDGQTSALAGSIAAVSASSETIGDATPEAGAMRLLVDIIGGVETPDAVERLSMEEEDAREDESVDALALEDVLLTVHVELAQRRMSLDDLSRLRPGQLLELGCQATDPVDLIADGRRIARGELVEIEGRLGVRLTQLAS